MIGYLPHSQVPADVRGDCPTGEQLESPGNRKVMEASREWNESPNRINTSSG